MSWAGEELHTIDLGDKRLNERAVKLLERLGEKPMSSIPGSCNGWAETQAAYRFLSQEDLSWEAIMTPHWACSEARMREQPVVLCLQDTTELDFKGRQMAGAGPLSYENQRGMYLHATYAVTPSREPLGVLDAWMWAREPKDATGQRAGPTESLRWTEGYERVAELAQSPELSATRLVYVADREADMRALLDKAQALGTPADWLIRARHNRSLEGGDKLWTTVARSAPLGEVSFQLPAGRGRAARRVRQTLRVARVTLPATTDAPALTVSLLMAEEIEAPAGVKPVLWRLLSNREIPHQAAARELITWYLARWEIELFFLILKQGCRLEALQLSTLARLERAMALYLIVSWRIGHLMRLGRTVPDLDVSLVLAEEEWQGAYLLAEQPMPKQPPTLNTALRMIARLGGFLGRKGDGEPGAKTLWLGLQRVMDFAAGLRYARQIGAF